MTLARNYSRRYVVKMLASSPIALPIAQSAAAAALGGAASGVASQAHQAMPSNRPITAWFESMPAPTLADPSAMARASVESTLILEDANGTQQVSQLSYQPFFKTGDQAARDRSRAGQYAPAFSRSRIICGGLLQQPF